MVKAAGDKEPTKGASAKKAGAGKPTRKRAASKKKTTKKARPGGSAKRKSPIGYRDLQDKIPAAVIDQAIASIQITGNYKQAYEILKITSTAFYDWRRRNPDIQKRVEEAEAAYYSNSCTVKTAIAESVATAMLRHGSQEITTIERDVLTEEGDIITLHSKKTVNKPAPLRLVERYLKVENTHAEYALIKMLVYGGYLPQAALVSFEDALSTFRSRITGITNTQADTFPEAEIRQKDLIDAATRAVQGFFTENAIAVSAEVSEGSEHDQDN